MPAPIPTTDPDVSLLALRALLRDRTVLAALEVFSDQLGPIFQINLPRFKPIMLVGPDAARFVLVSSREDLRWRSEGDPVTDLLRHGVLVEDGVEHDELRRTMNPALHKRMMGDYVGTMLRCVDQVCRTWSSEPLDMLVEMRRVALLILTETLFKVDLSPDIDRLWTPVLKSIQYISPGLWVLWPSVPRPGYTHALRELDHYLYEIIRLRRRVAGEGDDLLGLLVSSGMDDGLIRDQLLTMLIAGHDTSTALLSWTLYLLGRHPEALSTAQTEIESVLRGHTPEIGHVGELRYLDQVIHEALRMYPPIHLGSRITATDLEFEGYSIPANTRVMYSIYLTHHMKAHWPDPHHFDPQRFAPEAVRQRPPYVYLPFGGGPRNCIGALYGQIEAKIVLARVLQRYDLTLLKDRVHPHMGATLEPRPGVIMRAQPRQ